ncbi:hypothetical protein NPIL_269561 [Nephila pilipes]|uniref:Uncharacterized protein n=1 Tax=Nephila pilipes TaxID=299642 RepID=A0A8X6NZ79_NEPPI|nr:hypothetical protein NPIL_269561 [Nephila pilipes]
MWKGYIFEVCRTFSIAVGGTSSSAATSLVLVDRKSVNRCSMTCVVFLQQAVLCGKSPSPVVVDPSWRKYYGVDNTFSDITVGTPGVLSTHVHLLDRTSNAYQRIPCLCTQPIRNSLK